MNTKKNVFAVFALLVLLGFAYGCDNDSNAQAKVFSINEEGKPSYLFVLIAQSGTMDGDKLTLKGVPSAIYFSDRPSRIAGHKSVKDFAGLWNKSSDSFKADPPNATLSILTEEGAQNVVVELMDMKHEGEDVTFKVRVLEGTAPESFGPSSLFVDNLSMIADF